MTFILPITCPPASCLLRKSQDDWQLKFFIDLGKMITLMLLSSPTSGMDTDIKELFCKFKATSVHRSNLDSHIARRAIFAAALACIRKKHNGETLPPYLYEYYQQKSVSKPKMVALGAIMHKVYNIIFAVYSS